MTSRLEWVREHGTAADEARLLLRAATFICPQCLMDVRGYVDPPTYDEEGDIMCGVCKVTCR